MKGTQVKGTQLKGTQDKGPQLKAGSGKDTVFQKNGNFLLVVKVPTYGTNWSKGHILHTKATYSVLCVGGKSLEVLHVHVFFRF